MQVTWITRDRVRQEMQLATDLVEIGRSRNCLLNDPTDEHLSRRHAELRKTDAGWEVVNHGKNGTMVNGRTISAPTPLAEGDVIKLGNCALEIGGGPSGESTIQPSEQSSSERTIHMMRMTDVPVSGLARLLVDAARVIVRPMPSAEMLAALLELALKATHADRGMVAALAPGDLLTSLATAGSTRGGELRPSRAVLRRVIDHGEALILEDLALDQDIASSSTIISSGIRSVLCAPLGIAGKPWGMLYLDTVAGRAAFQPSHLEVVSTLAGLIHIVHESEEARRRNEAMKKIEAQMQAARDIQSMLLPAEHIVSPAGYCAAGRNNACLTVGGDIYDFFEWRAGYGVMLADVAGKGLSAAMIMANFHAWWHWVSESALPLEEWFPKLNDKLSLYIPDNRFVTTAFAAIDRERSRVAIASAGHTPVVLVHREGLEAIDPTGPPLGLLRGVPFEVREFPVTPGDRVVLFSDGLLDQSDRDGEPYGVERLCAKLDGSRGAPPAAMVETLLGDIDEFAQSTVQDDDMTIAILGLD